MDWGGRWGVASQPQPVRKSRQIVRDDLAVTMEVDHGFGCRVDDVVRTRERAPVGRIHPIRLRECLVPWEKIAARDQGMIENS